MKKNSILLLLSIIIISLILMGNPFYTLYEHEQAVITQFGKPIGDPIVESGLHLKLPFIQVVNKFDKWILAWDGYSEEIPTKDGKFIWMAVTARWRIKDALKFFQSVNNKQTAYSRLDGTIDGIVRDVVAANNLIEFVRSSNKVIEEIINLDEKKDFMDEDALKKIQVGRVKIREQILEIAKQDVPKYGIEIIDVRIKRINYGEKTRRSVYDRMIAERKQAAEKYRSEGRGTRAEIEGKTEKELKGILSAAYKEAQEIKGEADAKSTKIYAEAYNQDPELFSFLKTLETYKATLDENTTVILTTEGDYFKYLKEISPQ